MMNKTERYEKLMQLMSPCSKELYYKDEVQSELMGLKKVILNCTYNEEHAENMRLELGDVLRHLREKNDERGNVAGEYLDSLEIECEKFDAMLGREVAGNAGEVQAFRSLETMTSQNITFHNLELCNGENRGELDAVVITSKAVFLIEVKNSSHDMVIDAKGNYYRARGYMNMDYNIGEKVNNKAFLLRNALESAVKEMGKELKVVNYVVFANSRINVTNRYKYLSTCFLSQLPHMIDDFKSADIYTDEDMSIIGNALKDAEQKKAYPLDMDVKKLKHDFAMVMALLEMPETMEEPEVIVVEKLEAPGLSIWKKLVGGIGVAAACVFALTTATAIHKKLN